MYICNTKVNGITIRSFQIYNSAKKILAGTINYCHSNNECIDNCRKQSCICTVYLHPVLIMLNKQIWQTFSSICLILLMVFLYQKYKAENFNSLDWLVVVAALLLIILLFVFPLAKIIYKVWSLVTTSIGRLISKIALFIIYFGIFWPTALIRKMFGKGNQFYRQKKSDELTYFSNRNKKFNTDDFKNPW